MVFLFIQINDKQRTLWCYWLHALVCNLNGNQRSGFQIQFKKSLLARVGSPNFIASNLTQWNERDGLSCAVFFIQQLPWGYFKNSGESAHPFYIKFTLPLFQTANLLIARVSGIGKLFKR